MVVVMVTGICLCMNFFLFKNAKRAGYLEKLAG